jgi:hypothetical protein
LEISEHPELLFELGIERRGRGRGDRLGFEGGQLLEEGAQPGTVFGEVALLGGVFGYVVELSSAHEEEEALQFLPLSFVERSLVSEVLGKRFSRTRWGRVAEEPGQAGAGGLAFRLETSQLVERRGEVHELHDSGVAHGFALVWMDHEQGDVQDLAIELSVIEAAMVLELLSVVRGDDDGHVVREAESLQVGVPPLWLSRAARPRARW